MNKKIINALNEKFKEFFKDHYYKVKREGNGMKATNQSTSLTFYLDCGCCVGWYQEENNVDSVLYAKLPYSDYIVLRYEFKLEDKDLKQSVIVLDKIFTDYDFLQMLDWNLPSIHKKIQ